MCVLVSKVTNLDEMREIKLRQGCKPSENHIKRSNNMDFGFKNIMTLPFTFKSSTWPNLWGRWWTRSRGISNIFAINVKCQNVNAWFWVLDVKMSMYCGHKSVRPCLYSTVQKSCSTWFCNFEMYSCKFRIRQDL